MSTTSMEAIHEVGKIQHVIQKMQESSDEIKSKNVIEFTEEALRQEDRLREIQFKAELNCARGYPEDIQYLSEAIEQGLKKITFFVQSLLCPQKPKRVTD